MALAPVPIWAMVMEFGCSWSKGVSGCAVATPEAIGYSKLVEWAMISCPCFDVMKARNFCASAWCGLDLSTAAGEMSST
jgi:hypothetical protein